MSIFDKWNEQINGEKLAEEVKEVAQNSGEYKEVPKGEYEVKVEKMELKESRAGAPMVAIQFRILDGEYKNSCLFFNQVVTQAFQLHICNEFLKSMDSGIDVDFDGNYLHYNEMICDIFEAIDREKIEFLLSYTERRGFPVYKIKEVYAG
jgi:hypothetical protein